MHFVSLIWKVPVVTVALAVGSIAASQVGWSGAELVVNSPLMGPIEDLVTGLFVSLAAVVSVGSVLLVQRIARPAIWVAAPLLLYHALVPGVWNGFASDFDATRLEALRYHMANAYALQHMNLRGLYLSCDDDRIELTDDASIDT